MPAGTPASASCGSRRPSSCRPRSRWSRGRTCRASAACARRCRGAWRSWARTARRLRPPTGGPLPAPRAGAGARRRRLSRRRLCGRGRSEAPRPVWAAPPPVRCGAAPPDSTKAEDVLLRHAAAAAGAREPRRRRCRARRRCVRRPATRSSCRCRPVPRCAGAGAGAGVVSATGVDAGGVAPWPRSALPFRRPRRRRPPAQPGRWPARAAPRSRRRRRGRRSRPAGCRRRPSRPRARGSASASPLPGLGTSVSTLSVEISSSGSSASTCSPSLFSHLVIVPSLDGDAHLRHDDVDCGLGCHQLLFPTFSLQPR